MSGPHQSIRDEASAWLARSDRGLSAVEQQEFDNWCAADPRHAEAVESLQSAWQLFDQPREEGLGELLREDLGHLQRSQTRRRVIYGLSGLAAACLALVAWQRSSIPDVSVTEVCTAIVAQPARRVLPDGSVIVLRPGAEVAVNYSDSFRRVELTNGEALFQVAKSKQRPFIVSTGGIEVRAVGTAFTVDRNTTHVEVVVTEGRVAVEKPSDVASVPTPVPLATLGKGESVTVALSNPSPTPVVALDSAAVSEKLSWQLPRLEFSKTPLAEAVKLFNEHNAAQLRVADDEIAQLRITGVFRSDNLEGFVDLLETSFHVRTSRSERTISLRKPL